MNMSANAMPDSSFDSPRMYPAATSATQPFYWCVRRELWEYRSIYLAPLAIAGVILLGYFIELIPLSHMMRAAMAMDPSHQRGMLAHPFNIAAGLIMGAAFIVSIFYSLDALYGERRDRSILFWKSLPVSDLTTVLSKASIAFVVLPMVAFVITLATETIMLLLSSIVLLANGLSVPAFWGRLELYQTMLMLLYHLVTIHVLWYAPLYAWLLLVSAWARRAPFLWLALPPFAVAVFEKVVFHTSYFARYLGYRFSGGPEAVNNMQGDFPMDPALHLTPGKFLAAPGLWGGLIVAAVFLAIAVQLRRYRDPN